MRACFFIAASMLVATTLWSGPAAAYSDRPYWPAYEIRDVPEGCIRWNWQQLSYYNYCPRLHQTKVLRVRG